MLHRHLNHQDFTLAAIDDLIARGKRADWLELRNAVHENPELREKVRMVCSPKLADPYAQRYYLWNYYVQERRFS